MEQATQTVQQIEGISPQMLWTFLIVLVGLATLFILGYKVIEILRKEHERKTQKQQLTGNDITDQIATKVMEKLQPKLDEKFSDIDRKLAADKELIDLHTRQLNAHEDRVKKLEEGNKALCHGIFALLNHEVTGNSIDKLKRAETAMKNYLIDGVYLEE
jgi:uncharacterized protein HemX